MENPLKFVSDLIQQAADDEVDEVTIKVSKLVELATYLPRDGIRFRRKGSVDRTVI